jgi:phosphoribosyl 1,2-cyclic phosphodiesterase
MEVRVLGGYQGEWRDGNFSSFVIDGHLAIDAGSLASGLTFEEQERIRHVLITHRHFDHVKDLPSFGFNMMTRTVVTIHALLDVQETLEATLFSDRLFINFFRGTARVAPSMRFSPVSPGQAFDLDGYSILPVAVNHAVPCVGYQVADPDGRTFFYTGDNGPGAGREWAVATPDVLATEVTFSNRAADVARSAGHLTPAFLAQEIVAFRQLKGYVPRIVVVHRNPDFADEIERELVDVSNRLGVAIVLGTEGVRVQI